LGESVLGSVVVKAEGLGVDVMACQTSDACACEDDASYR
jgi:hypothetical protein